MRSTFDNPLGIEIHSFLTVMSDLAGEHEFKVNVEYEYDPGEAAERDYAGSGASATLLRIVRTEDGRKIDISDLDRDLLETLRSEIRWDIKSRTNRDDIEVERWDGMA